MTGTFLDTFIVCTITGLVLITTGAWKSGKTGVEATTLAFQSVFGTAGSMILGITNYFIRLLYYFRLVVLR